jgi:nitrate reductase cytochrome c-type subunit
MRSIYIGLATCVAGVFLLMGCNGDSPVVSANTGSNSYQPEVKEIASSRAEDSHQLPAKTWLAAEQVYNKEAPIPPQCYTKTNKVNNPCYVCHQSYMGQDGRPNKLNDGFQQGSYAFSDKGLFNSWRNLFKDRRAAIADISDQEIIDYINQDNYSPLIDKLKDSDWQGVIPEVKNLHLGAAAFDENGLAKDGSAWVAFNYKPLPSTFWPTNGSTDDVMIKLPEVFRQIDGEDSLDAYYANLALLEMAIADTDQTTTIPLNEVALGVDLDGDGSLQQNVKQVLRKSHYVGDAHQTPLHKMLYPEGTAFLHTVRYVNVDDSGGITVSKRMKEVRYMAKKKFLSEGQLKGRYYLERKEKHFENLPYANDFGDEGLSNKHGWVILGFIEDQQGELRQQNHEEQFFCTGCHKSIGSTIDDTFSFPRKVAGANGWGYIDLKSIADAPNIGEDKGEFLTYLQRVGGGDEFRQNQEMLARWFKSDGSVEEQKVAALPSIYELITPSPRRALDLNKAYLTIVKEQSFIYGRDATLVEAQNVLSHINEEQPPLLPEHIHQWDMRLDWSERAVSELAKADK